MLQLEKRINATTVVKINGKDTKEAFENLVEADKVFGQDVCGACKVAGARPQIRTHGEHTFFEMACQNPKCKAKLGFYFYKGKMLPSLTNKDKSYKTNGGWEIYDPSKNGQAHLQEPAREPQDYSQEQEADIPF